MRSFPRLSKNALWAPARIPPAGDYSRARRRLRALRLTRRAASDTVFKIKELEHRTGDGHLAPVPKLVGNAWHLHEHALSVLARRRRLRSLGLVSCIVPGSCAEVLRVTIIDNAEVIGRMSPVTVVNSSSPMRSIIYACCFVLRLVIFLLNWSMTCLCVVWRKHLRMRRHRRRFLSNIRYFWVSPRTEQYGDSWADSWCQS